MKNLYITLFLLSFLTMFSCNTNEKARYIIGVSQCSDDLWRQTMNNEMLLEASIYQNIDVEIKTVKDDTQQQIKDIESLIDNEVDLLIISPNESTAITPVIQKAFKAGIPVILVDRKIETEDYTAYMGADNYQIGKEVGLYIAGILNGKGNVAEIRGWNGSTSDTERHAGFINAIQNYPDIKIIAEKRGNFLKDEAAKHMTDILKEHNLIDLVFAMNDPMALGVHEAISKYSGKSPFIIGIDALPGEGGGIENIHNGLQDASFIYPTGGDKVIDLAIKILTNQPFSRENTLYTAVVDKSNVRVLQLQTEHISEHQKKVEKINSLLNKSITQYSNQTTLFYGTILILALISILLFLSIFAYRNKSRSNRLLEEQKNQLISLSKQLEEATHAKLVFFTNISHEFRTPLTLILGPVETLLDSPNLTDEQKTLLDLVKRNSNSLLNLISQIIEFRSYENGKMNTYFVESDMKLFLEELNIAFLDYAKRKKVLFSFISDNNNSYNLYFDKDKIEKIYFNLLSNAFKYTEKEGHIKVYLTRELSENNDYLKLSVFNDGKNIPKDKINSIFDRFYKVNPHDSGTGIGLALTSSLVDVHNGKIFVESINGEGTTFTVLIPYQQQEAINLTDEIYDEGYTTSQLETEVIESPDNKILSNLLDDDKDIVLLIEDNPDMRRYMRLILRNEYTVIEAEDGESGIGMAIKFIPDIVLCDVMMPGKDGFEVCTILKENVFTSHIPVILLTACSLDEQKALGFQSGADAYIPKPFNAGLLKIRIEKLIESRKKIRKAFGNSLINDTKKTSLAEIEQSFINKFQEYVEKNITDPELNVVDIARYLGLSRSQLYRKIKSLTDYPPNEFIRIIRLKYAMLMISAGVPISDIAYRSGFSSASYFTKCFKEFYKTSPTDF
ncbi:substrate-binding domain-containing protein, partial [Dysgonomonas sp. ZJ279]|uniref:hybrid sensor histidine kinase/response regulator transcription factor n=1 Tax=Dysgonomonas sp. ZJ279 TaxID=2709796 RepID=UPI002104C21A